MPETVPLRARPRTKRHRTLAALIGILALGASFLVPGQAGAVAGNNPTGSLDSVSITANGSVTASGWAADADSGTTVLRVNITDNGTQKASVLANAPRADVAAVYPAFGASHGFAFSLVLSDGAHQICAIAENVGLGANTQLGCRNVSVANNPTGTMGTGTVNGNTVTFAGTATDANATGPLTVRAYVNGVYAAGTSTAAVSHAYTIAVPVAEGSNSVCLYAINVGQGANVQLGCQSIPIRNNPFGAVDSASQTPTGVIVSGWAIDLNTTEGLTVYAYVDGKYFTQSIASLPRPDVAKSYPSAGPNHGYSMLLALASGTHQICVNAINVGPGSTVQLRCSTVTVQNNPIGSVERVVQLPTGVQVSGWALDLNSTSSVTVNVSVDAKLVTSTVASVARTDIAARYPSVGANHGFSLLLNLAAGAHTVCLDAINVGPGVNSRLGCVAITVRNDPIGNLETVAQVPGGIKFSGWALDLNTANPIVVSFYIDGKYAGQTNASIDRPGLAAVYPTVGSKHAFSQIIAATPGRHTVCAYAINVGPGTHVKLRCVTLTLKDSPLGNLENVQQAPGGVRISGWAMDAFQTQPVTIRVYVDGRIAAISSAAGSRPGLLNVFPNMGPNHAFTINTPVPVGTHRLCAYVINPRGGPNLNLPCVSVTRAVNPMGVSGGIERVGTTNTIAIRGWVLDPDTTGPIQLHITSDGVDKQTVTANLDYAPIAQKFPVYGSKHAYSGAVELDPGEHRVCVIAYNVGPGVNTSLGCALITTSGEGAPAVPTSVTALPGSRSVALSWVAPLSANAPITSYQITVVQRTGTTVVSAGTTGYVVTGLNNGGHYTFTVRAVNSFGRGSAATVAAVPTNIPPQTTPAPVSTSHYVRNLTGNLTTDAALMRTMGAGDASRNPSGHSYLVLLQIGGQDETNKGALLSATSKFVSYPAVVSAMKAYLDGYATTQKAYAPLTLAIGTNNDVDVSLSAGLSWAINVINPVLAYAAAHHPGIVIAGANDMEPGFSASITQTRAWLSGYLAGTTAMFVFNGSADGCSTNAIGSRCNNGWTMLDLQWLSGGAAASRTISLPQIYNSAMPLQWKYISLSGTAAGRVRINFGGPLTERTACDQAGSCASITNVVAWTQLWNAISSSAAIKQSQLPHGTDLRIN